MINYMKENKYYKEKIDANYSSQRWNLIGNSIYDYVQKYAKEMTPKIVGMIISIEDELEIMRIIDNEQNLI